MSEAREPLLAESMNPKSRDSCRKLFLGIFFSIQKQSLFTSHDVISPQTIVFSPSLILQLNPQGPISRGLCLNDMNSKLVSQSRHNLVSRSS